MFSADDLKNMLENIFISLSSMIDGVVEKLVMTPEVAFGKVFWDNLLDVTTKAFIPIALLLLAIFMATELYHVFSRNNGEINTQVLVLTSFKFVFPFAIITQIGKLMEGIYSILNGVIISLSNNMQLGTATDSLDVLSSLHILIDDMSFGERFGFWVQLFIIWLVVQAIGIIVTIIVYGRIFELMLYWLIAPLPFATFVHNEHSQIFKNFIKLFIALILQGILIFLCILIYSNLSQTVLTGDPQGAVWELLGYSALLVLLMTKSGQIAKRMVGTF